MVVTDAVDGNNNHGLNEEESVDLNLPKLSKENIKSSRCFSTFILKNCTM